MCKLKFVNLCNSYSKFQIDDEYEQPKERDEARQSWASIGHFVRGNHIESASEGDRRASRQCALDARATKGQKLAMWI